MYTMNILGIFYLVMAIAIPVLSIFVAIWVHQIKTNSETMVEQNKVIIESIKKDGE